MRLRQGDAALCFATGVIVAIEFSAAALLPQLARGLDVPLAEAATLISAFALASCVAGPPLTGLVPRRWAKFAMIGALLCFAIGNFAAVGAPCAPVLLLARIVQGAALPAFVSLAIAGLVRRHADRPRGTSLALLNAGVVAGGVVMLPLALLLGGRLDWRAGFAVLGGLAAVAAVWVAASVPPTRTGAGDPPEERVADLARVAVAVQFGLSTLTFCAMFCGYSYLTAFLGKVSGLPAAGQALAMAGFAAAGLGGNAAAGRLVDRHATSSAAAVLVILAIAVAGAGVWPRQIVVLALAIPFWGGAHAACFVLCQGRLLKVAPAAPAMASALNISASNFGIALGAAIGGVIVEQLGLAFIPFGVAGLAAASAALVLASGLTSRRRDGSPCYS